MSQYSHLVHLDGISLVYFIQGGVAIKIGSSWDISRRLATLQVASPDTLELLGVIPRIDAQQAEYALHKRFKGTRIRGEWFNPTPELTTYIEEHAVNAEDVDNEEEEETDADFGELLKHPQYKEPRPLLTLQQLATELQIHEATLARYVRAGTIPCLRVGRQLRFYPPAIYEYLRRITPFVEKLQRKYGTDPFVDDDGH